MQEIHPEWFSVAERMKHSDDDLRRILSTMPLFENLPRRYWRELSILFHERKYDTDEVIFKSGTPGLGMYIIISGAVKVMGESGKNEIEFARLKAGDFFGEMSLVDEIDRSATAIAIEPTRLVGVFRPHMQDLMHRRPRLGMLLLDRLVRIIATRLREANRLLIGVLGESRD